MNWPLWCDITSDGETVAHAVANFSAKQTRCGIRITSAPAPASPTSTRCVRCEEKIREGLTTP